MVQNIGSIVLGFFLLPRVILGLSQSLTRQITLLSSSLSKVTSRQATLLTFFGNSIAMALVMVARVREQYEFATL